VKGKVVFIGDKLNKQLPSPTFQNEVQDFSIKFKKTVSKPKHTTTSFLTAAN
jgi:hypothetical protein